jgi:type II secretory pathway component GspD/PulD (secretin)
MFKRCLQVAMLLSLAALSAPAQERGSTGQSALPSSRPKPPRTVEQTNPPSAPRVRSSAPPVASTSSAAPTIQKSEPLSVVSTKDSAKYRRTVFRLRAIPAVDAARTLEQVFRAEGKATPRDVPTKQAVIVPDAVGNSIVVSGPPEAVEEIGQLIETLDHPAAMVRLEVVIVETPAEPSDAVATKDSGGEKPRVVPKPAQMEVLIRGELTTLDNQQAFLQVGRRESRLVGVAINAMGRANSIEREDVGTIVRLTPRVGPDRAVTLELTVEDSRLGPAEEGIVVAIDKEGQETRTPNTETLMFQSTVCIPDGETVTLAGMTRQAKSGKKRLILVTPRVLPVIEAERRGDGDGRR